MRKEFKKWESAKQSFMTIERIAKLNNLGFEWVVSREKCQPKSKSTSNKHHQRINNNQDPKISPMFQDQRHQQQFHQQHQHGPEEVSSAFSCYVSVEGGETFCDISEESERHKDQPQPTRTPQHQHQPQ